MFSDVEPATFKPLNIPHLLDLTPMLQPPANMDELLLEDIYDSDLEESDEERMASASHQVAISYNLQSLTRDEIVDFKTTVTYKRAVRRAFVRRCALQRRHLQQALEQAQEFRASEQGHRG